VSGTDHKPLLEVENLGIQLSTSRGPAQAVREVSFVLKRGETLDWSANPVAENRLRRWR